MAQTETDKELGEIVGALMGVAALAYLWKAKLRPWLDHTWASLGRGDTFTIGGTSWDSTDLIGLGAIVLVAVVVFLAARRKMRERAARRAERKREREQERGA